eukprot:gnl/Dysnectes_brevis/1698_a1931_1936.p1 GENE.gnl/Dysnectes_brevis/1698_a1931_1936~~gnl/Dysnectes_brevis/1698_a1931_1936.p1  ORF type:complete len:241 (+),score=68.36 gnl/Dysnectes_brevis/1698_a1931_1936:76-798(+)
MQAKPSTKDEIMDESHQESPVESLSDHALSVAFLRIQMRDIQLVLSKMVEFLSKQTRGGDFARPVDTSFSDYYSIVQNPMDFSTLRQNTISGKYTYYYQFLKHFGLIWNNCEQYNGILHPLTKAGRKLEAQGIAILESLPYVNFHGDPDIYPAIVRRPLSYFTSGGLAHQWGATPLSSREVTKIQNTVRRLKGDTLAQALVLAAKMLDHFELTQPHMSLDLSAQKPGQVRQWVEAIKKCR